MLEYRQVIDNNEGKKQKSYPSTYPVSAASLPAHKYFVDFIARMGRLSGLYEG